MFLFTRQSVRVLHPRKKFSSLIPKYNHALDEYSRPFQNLQIDGNASHVSGYPINPYLKVISVDLIERPISQPFKLEIPKFSESLYNYRGKTHNDFQMFLEPIFYEFNKNIGLLSGQRGDLLVKPKLDKRPDIIFFSPIQNFNLAIIEIKINYNPAVFFDERAYNQVHTYITTYNAPYGILLTPRGFRIFHTYANCSNTMFASPVLPLGKPLFITFMKMAAGDLRYWREYNNLQHSLANGNWPVVNKDYSIRF